MNSEITNICKNMKYGFYLRGETVFYQGQQSEYFYVILTGQVAVLENKKMDEYSV